MFVHSWLVFPIVMLLVSLGCGLVAARCAGGLDPVLVLPCGFAGAVVVASAMTLADATAELAAPTLGVVAVAGLGLGVLDHVRDRAPIRPHRDWLWPALAGLLAFGAIGAPVLLTGRAGFTGYARIVDIAYQLDLTAHLLDHGRQIPAVNSAATQVVLNTLTVGYPTGAQSLLGTSSWLAGIDPIWSWQPFMASLSGMLALSLYSVLRRAVGWRPGRALAAGVAAQPTILYAYSLAGGIKELAAAAMLALLVATLTAPPPAAAVVGVARWRQALPSVLVFVAGLAVFNVGFLPWAGTLLVVVLAPRLRGWRPSRPSPRTAALMAGAAVAILAPVAVSASDLWPLLREGGPTQAGSELGNLAAPVPHWSVVGPWITQDHRFPLTLGGDETLTKILAALVGALALAGLARAARRRDAALTAAAAAGLVGMAFVVWRGNAWIDLKAACVTAPLVAALAFGGTPLLRRGGAVIAGLLITGALLAGNARHYEATTLAPTDRLRDLEAIAYRHPNVQKALMTSWEEYGEYLLRDQHAITLASVPTDPTFFQYPNPNAQFWRDTDEFASDYLQGFDLLVVRRDSTASRPPSDYTLSERTRFYDVWRRNPSPTVVQHFSLGGSAPGRTREYCKSVLGSLRQAGSDAQLAYVPAPAGLRLPAPEDQLPGGWLRDADVRLARGPGRVSTTVTLAFPATWQVSMAGSYGRRVGLSVDGRPVGSLRWRESYPGQYEPVGTVTLAAGRHRFEITRGGGSLLPGSANDLSTDGFTTRIGPLLLTLVRDRPPEPRYVDARAGARICRSDRPLDWIEVVKRASGPTGAPRTS